MMNWYGGGMMDHGFGGLGLLNTLFWLVVFVDLILLGFWLWRQLQKK